MKHVLSLILTFALAFTMTSCEPAGPTDEEIIGKLGEQFLLAMFKSDKSTAEKICNQTGLKTFESMSSMMKLGTLGLNDKLDDVTLLSQMKLLEVRKISETRGFSKYMCIMGVKPSTFTIPCEKSKDGHWKVAVTKEDLS